MRKLIFAGILAILAVIAGCGSNPSADTTITEGTWNGFYMDTIPVAFSVSGSSMQNVTLAVEYDFFSIPDTTIVWQFDADITDDTFQYFESSGSTPYSFSIDFQGTFAPPDHVSGSILTTATYDSAGVSSSDTLDGSWSAGP